MAEAYFGPAGNPEAFYQSGLKSSQDMPRWLADLKLNAYEYQCSRGVVIGQQSAEGIGKKAQEAGVKLSIHAPYYINLATEEPTIAANTRQHILKSLQVAQWMGADRVVFHIGGPGKQVRVAAMGRAQELFLDILADAEGRGLMENVVLAPETMGKQNQLGDLAEVLGFCQLSPKLIPTIDFGHLYAVTGGQYITRGEIETVFDQVVAALGEQVAANIHIHFSRIEFTTKGEKRHWTFEDDAYGPPHLPLLEVIAARGYTPRIICESAGTQARDARTMQETYWQLVGKKG